MDPDLLSTVAHLSDDALISRVKQLAAREREATAVLIAHLAEMDVRRLYLGEGCSSLFTYCTQVLHLSEHAAYGRIEAARAVRRFPVILERLEEGSVTLTTVGLLAAHLTGENHRDLLDAARCQSKRQVEELVARLRPQQAVPASVRRLPLPRPPVGVPVPGSPGPEGSSLEPAGAATERELSAGAPGRSFLLSSAPVASTPARRAAIAPLAPERYKVQFTASAETYEKLRLAQALLRHQIPDGDVAVIFDRALTMLLQELTKQKLAATDRPRERSGAHPHSRHIPAEVKRVVWQRDGGRCVFVSRTGRRCAEQGFLEFHHVVPYAVGGEATAENIELRCRAHNGYEAEQVFGRGKTSGVKETRAAYVSSKEQPSALRGLQPSAVARGRTEQQITDSGHVARITSLGLRARPGRSPRPVARLPPPGRRGKCVSPSW